MQHTMFNIHRYTVDAVTNTIIDNRVIIGGYEQYAEAAIYAFALQSAAQPERGLTYTTYKVEAETLFLDTSLPCEAELVEAA